MTFFIKVNLYQTLSQQPVRLPIDHHRHQVPPPNSSPHQSGTRPLPRQRRGTRPQVIS